MKNVLHERGIQLQEHETAKEYEKLQNKLYGENLRAKVAREEAEEMEKQRRIHENNLKNQDLLLRQARYNHDREEREKQYDLALFKRMQKEEEIFEREQQRILNEDIPEDVNYRLKQTNFYT